jgi:hypothetical protein
MGCDNKYIDLRQLMLYLEELNPSIKPPHPETIKKWIREAKIPCHSHGTKGMKLVFDKSKIDEWNKNGRTKTTK